MSAKRSQAPAWLTAEERERYHFALKADVRRHPREGDLAAMFARLATIFQEHLFEVDYTAGNTPSELQASIAAVSEECMARLSMFLDRQTEEDREAEYQEWVRRGQH